MRDYIEMKIKAFQEANNPKVYLSNLASADLEFRKSWKSELDQENMKWSKIKTNEDVIDLINRFDGAVRYVENHVKPGGGITGDGYNMALAEYDALLGLRKLAKFIDDDDFEFKTLTEKEIDELFERMAKIAERMDEQNMRRAMQD